MTHSNVVLAVPATELAKLVMNGRVGRRIIDRIPELSQLQRMREANVLVVTVVFKTRLPDIPREHVGLAGSLGYLTYIDISQLWTDLIEKPHTVLVLAASDRNFYPSSPDEDWAHMMLKELAAYLPAAKPGKARGDPDSNIDYERTVPQNNHKHRLFLSDMNSEHLLVEPYYPEQLRNVFFAGDFCRNDVNMATVDIRRFERSPCGAGTGQEDGWKGRRHGRPFQPSQLGVVRGSEGCFASACVWRPGLVSSEGRTSRSGERPSEPFRGRHFTGHNARFDFAEISF